MKNRLILYIASAFALVSCNGLFHPEYDAPVISYADSTDYALVKLNVQLPSDAKGSGSIIRSTVYTELVSFLGICSSSYEYIPFDEWMGDPTDLQAMTDFYGEQALKYADGDAAYDSDMIKQGTIGRYEFIFDVNKVAESRTYVVYGISGYVYTGGMHGNMIDGQSFIFRKCDGKQIRYVIDRTKSGEMQEIVFDGLKSYVAQSGEELDDDMLFCPEDEIPLPAREPYITDDGVVFIYGEYEVMPYCYGQPTFTVPYEKILPYLSQEVRDLVD